MFSELKQVLEIWSKAFSSKTLRNQFFLSVLLFAGMGAINFHFLRIWQARPGLQMDDSILNMLPPRDFSVLIFFVEYVTIVVVLVFNLPYPERIVKALQMYAFVIFARTVTIYLLPLEPPRDMVFLHDPFADYFLHSKDVVVTKDLFFSGHVAALTLLILMSKNKYVKIFAFFGTLIVGILVLWQHVHYSVDVIFAPIFAFAGYLVVILVHKESRFGLDLKFRQQET